MKNIVRAVLFASALVCVQTVCGQTTAITYQGNLSDGATPANGTYQMEFAVYNAVGAGTQQGSTVTNNSVSVVNGVFTVLLDFGATVFPAGADRWLELRVKKPADAGFSTLSPRQQLTNSPYSIRTVSTNAADALSAACVQCVANTNVNSISAGKITGAVPSATTATTATNATNVTGIVAIANGGTGSSTKNFVDLSTDQTVGGNKTFINNLTVNGTLTANLGQTMFADFGTAALTLTPSAAFIVVPGLTRTFTVPAGYTAYVTSDGGVATTSATANGFSALDAIIALDSAFLANGAYERVLTLNTAGLTGAIRYWNLTVSIPLTAGTHTIATFVGGIGSGANSTVSGVAGSPLQGRMVITLVKN